MTGRRLLVRRVPVIAVVATVALWSAPAPASASVTGVVCSLGGLVSGLAGKVCDIAAAPGRIISAGKRLFGGDVGGALEALGGATAKRAAAVVGLAAVGAVVVEAAHSALRKTVTLIGSTTSPNLRSTWFSAFYWRMAAVAALLTLPFLFAAAIQALIRSDLALLARAAFGYLPLGMLAIGVAAPLTNLLLAGSDEMSAIVSSASGHVGGGFLLRTFSVSALGANVFVSMVVGVVTVGAAVGLWVELVIREAAVYVIVLMLPLFFAAMVWPARRVWAVRAVELLVALILSKFAIVAVIALGGAALEHTASVGVAAAVAGAALVLLAAFTPWALLRILPLHELASAAAGGLSAPARGGAEKTGGRAHRSTDMTEDRIAAIVEQIRGAAPGDGSSPLDGVDVARTNGGEREAASTAVETAGAPPADATAGPAGGGPAAPEAGLAAVAVAEQPQAGPHGPGATDAGVAPEAGAAPAPWAAAGAAPVRTTSRASQAMPAGAAADEAVASTSGTPEPGALAPGTSLPSPRSQAEAPSLSDRSPVAEPDPPRRPASLEDALRAGEGRTLHLGPRPAGAGWYLDRNGDFELAPLGPDDQAELPPAPGGEAEVPPEVEPS